MSESGDPDVSPVLKPRSKSGVIRMWIGPRAAALQGLIDDANLLRTHPFPDDEDALNLHLNDIEDVIAKIETAVVSLEEKTEEWNNLIQSLLDDDAFAAEEALFADWGNGSQPVANPAYFAIISAGKEIVALLHLVYKRGATKMNAVLRWCTSSQPASAQHGAASALPSTSSLPPPQASAVVVTTASQPVSFASTVPTTAGVLSPPASTAVVTTAHLPVTATPVVSTTTGVSTTASSSILASLSSSSTTTVPATSVVMSPGIAPTSTFVPASTTTPTSTHLPGGGGGRAAAFSQDAEVPVAAIRR